MIMILLKTMLQAGQDQQERPPSLIVDVQAVQTTPLPKMFKQFKPTSTAIWTMLSMSR